ncbi:alanine--glyoxylate aminotransferase family protein [Ideonella sp. A 288]|uniref:pyridoxal-phosphate-dependent aminotransferase family protein n=1 Tax=Ideonella sp. A 288 TaxID=1962181 RepID=UPI000B4BFF70|nr:aminotransferase class V-fold PLP-dependent enzyme [Ideonella sp. A 288]
MTQTARIPGRRLLHSPGPTPLPEEVLDALRRQPMDLGDPRVSATIDTCERGLRRLLCTEAADVFFYAANGHGAWEVVVENLVPPGGAVLIPGTGHFSESWAVQTEALGRRVVRTPWVEGLPIDLAAVQQALRDDRDHAIVAVFAVHTDTSSSATTDLPALRAAIDATGHPALFVVDAVASLGAMPVPMDALRANVVLSASQKALMTPPGVAIVAVDAQAAAVAARNPGPRFYWDWRPRQSELSYRKFCGTAPQNLMMALEAALGLIFLEGEDAVFARHRLLARTVQAAVEGWRTAGALDFFVRDPAARSVSVTTITVPPGTDVDAMRAVARDRFQVAFAGALGPLAGRGFRIGHLGDQNAASILGALGGVQAALRVMGVPHGDGMARAVECLAAGDA